MSVPNTSTFWLGDVTNEIGISPASLGDCFADANTAGFDLIYEGFKDRLSNFRNYNHSAFSFIITPNAVTNYYDYGTAYYPYPQYEIDASEGWYGIVDDSAISGLDFSVLYSADGYVASAEFIISVGSNSGFYTRLGSVSFYKNSDDTYMGTINACQDGYAEYCG